jgi:hypothetical protein
MSETEYSMASFIKDYIARYHEGFLLTREEQEDEVNSFSIILEFTHKQMDFEKGHFLDASFFKAKFVINERLLDKSEYMDRRGVWKELYKSASLMPHGKDTPSKAIPVIDLTLYQSEYEFYKRGEISYV